MRSLLVGFFSFIFIIQITAQTFQEVGALGLTDISSGDAVWGDYDNDGDLDILLTGNSITKVYKNNGNGTFTDIVAGLAGIYDGDCAWGDFDNDNDLDIIITGGGITKIYRNNGANTFVDINASLIGLSSSTVAWGDYDNDGDLDVLLTGNYFVNPTTYYTSRVYKNNGNGVFVDTNAGLFGVNNGSSAWGDYDNDGDLDILLTGYNSTSPNYYSKVYKNNGNATFTEISTAIIGVQQGAVAWGDYDNDGDLDILLTGYNGNTSPYYYCKVYKNTNGVFSDSGISLLGAQQSAVAWGDYDNDGDLDILLTGYNGTTSPYYHTKIYKNGNNTFTEVTSTLFGANNPGFNNSSLAWGDYDIDGDLDILLTGYNSSFVPNTKVYRNDIVSTANKLPVAPITLSKTTTTTSATLTWGDGTDIETPAAAREYNIYVRNDYNEFVVSPSTKSLTDGKRSLQESGNAGQLKTKTINLPSGTYFWAVQTLDRQGGSSPWSTENTFVIGDGKRPAPIITGISRSLGNPGEIFEIYGDYFASDKSKNSVLIGTYPATVTDASRYKLVCTIPYGTPGTYSISVQVAEKTTTYADNSFTIRGEYQWKKSTTSVVKNLNAVFCTAPKKAWAVGLDGTVIKTTDGAETWNSVTSATIGTTTLSSVYFTHPDTGWVAGVGGKIFKTVDAGANWISQTSGTTKDITNLFFQSGKTGWATGKQGTLLKTINGGTTWSPVSISFNGDINQIIFADATRAWAAGSGGTILYSTDGGLNWFTLALGSNSWSSISQNANQFLLASNVSTTYYFNNNSGTSNSWTPATLPSGPTGLNFITYLKPTASFFGIGKAGVSGTLSINTATNPISSTFTSSGTTFPVFTEDLNSVHSIGNWGLACGSNGAMAVYKPYPKSFPIPLIDSIDPQFAFPSTPFITMMGAGFTDISKVKLNDTEVDIADKKDYQLKIKTDNINVENTYTISIKKGEQDWINTNKTFSINRFKKKEILFQGVSLSSSAWGDYDNDGDLDIVLTGSNNGYHGKIYTNANGTFTEAITAFTGADNGSVTWGDYDNDGYLDLLSSGYFNGAITKVFKNSTNGNFIDLNAPFIGLSAGSVEWGDYDRDGDLDALLTGWNNANAIAYSKVYNNKNGVFTDINAGLPESSDGYATWGDYDNDGYLDIALVGWANARIFKNNGNNTFTNINAGLLGLEYSSAAWGDYDTDGDLDLLVCGYQSSQAPNYFTKIYKNDNGVFTDINAGLIGLRNGYLTWSDFDSDGDLDATITGKDNTNTARTSIYQNNSGAFTPIIFFLPGKIDGSASWGDYDNDGDLDLFLSGNNSSELFENLTNPKVIYPPVPDLTYKLEKGKIIFNWTVPPGTSAGTTYNLRVGKSAGSGELVSPASLSTGRLTTPRRGNMGTQKTWSYTIPNTGAGKYYFSVQSVNQSLQSSAFSSEQFVTIDKTDLSYTQNLSNKLTVLTVDNQTIKVQLDYGLEIVNSGFGFTVPVEGVALKIYKSTDELFDDQDEVLGTDTLKTIPSIGTRSKKLRITPSLVPGTYYILIKINQDKKVEEGNYDNNTLIIPLVIPVNDITIRIKNTKVWPLNKKNIPYKLSIKHLGINPSTGTKNVKIFRSLDNLKSNDDLLLYEEAFPKELKNDSIVADKELNLKDGLTYHDYFLIAEVTTSDDSNISNNSYASPLLIARADIAVKNIYIPSTAYQHAAKMPISYRIKNTGSSIDWLTTDPTAEIFYTSTQDISAPKTSIAKVQFKKLDYLDSISQTTIVSLPDEVKPGVGYFWVNVDSEKLTDDINLSNNTGNTAKTITVSGKSPKAVLTTSSLLYPKNATVKVDMVATDSVQIKSSTVYFRAFTKKLGQNKIATTKTSEATFSVEISSKGEDDNQGIYAWAVVENASGKKGLSDTLAFSLKSDSLLTIALKGGIKVNNFQIVSFPRSHDSDPLKEFTDALGPQNKSLGIGEIQNWRLYRYNKGEYEAYDQNFEHETGKGYWVISKDAKDVQIKSGASISKQIIKLNPEWTLIGNPFDFDLDWTQAKGSTKGLSDIYVFRDGEFSKKTELKPMEGAFVHSTSKDTVQVTLNSFQTSARKTGVVSQNDLWKLNFSVTKGDLTNSTSSAGMLENAAEKIIEPSMPRFIEFVDLVSADFKSNNHDAASIRVPADTSYIWNYVLKSNIKEKYTHLKWSFETMPDQEVFLHDRERERMVNMREVSEYSFESLANHRLSIYYGSLAFIYENLKPTTVAIGQLFPNPHSGKAQLQLAVPGGLSGTLTCEMYDQLGRSVFKSSTHVEPGFTTIQLTDLPITDSIVLLKSVFTSANGSQLVTQKIKSH